MPQPKIIDLALEKLAQSKSAIVEALKPTKHGGKVHEETQRSILKALNHLERLGQLLTDDLVGNPLVERLEELRQVRDDNADGREISEYHESYGTISHSRVTGRLRLVGSMLDTVPNFIEVRMYRAHRLIDTQSHTERYSHTRSRPLFSFRMSSYQWAEFLTNPHGNEVPCTLCVIQGVEMNPVPEESLTPLERIAEDATNAMRGRTEDAEGTFNKILAELQAYLNDSKLTKARLQGAADILTRLRKMVSVPKNAADWAATRMVEDAERVVSQARAEIAASLESGLRQAGLPQLPQSVEIAHQLGAPELTRNTSDE